MKVWTTSYARFHAGEQKCVQWGDPTSFQGMEVISEALAAIPYRIHELGCRAA